MTTDELRAAAEEVANGEPTVDVHEYHGEEVGEIIVERLREEWREAAVAVARACLADHPADDGEPVTREWVKSVLPTRTLSITFTNPDGDEMLLGIIPVWTTNTEWKAWLDGLPICRVPTRGHVRRLLAALGIEHKGAT